MADLTYNDRSFSSMVLTLFIAKVLISFLLLFSFFGYDNSSYLLANPDKISGALDSSLTTAVDPETDNIIVDYGEITLGGVSEGTSTIDKLWGYAKFVYSTSMLNDFFSLNFGLSIPYIIWFFLIDIWAYIFTIQILRVFFKI